MADTNIVTLVTGNVNQNTIVEPTSNVSQNATDDIFATADTEKICSPNSVIKYLNIMYQAAIKPDIGNAFPGWIEWACVVYEEEQSDPGIDSKITSNIGTKSLQTLCKNLYRGNCIYAGSYGIAKELPSTFNCSLKLPPKFCKNKRGMYIKFLSYYRSVNSADVVSEIRESYNHMYKCYV